MTDRRIRLAIGAGIVIVAALAAFLRPTPSSSPGPSASPVAAGTIGSGSVPPDGVTPTAPVATAGPPVGFARFNWEQGYFDYPATWRYYLHDDPNASSVEHRGFLTNGAIDEDVGCGIVLGRQRCDPEAVDLGPGGVFVEILFVQAYSLDDVVRGWTDPRFDPTMVAGVPAHMTERDRSNRREISWSILNGRILWNSLELAIQVRKPNEAAALEQIDGIIDSLTFVPPIEPLDPSQGPAIAAQTVRAFREAEPGYECFPEVLDIENRMEVTSIGGYRLTQPLAVTCLTTIEATPINFWRLRLTARWEAAAGAKAGGMVITEWLAFDGTPGGGSKRQATPPYCCV